MITAATRSRYWLNAASSAGRSFQGTGTMVSATAWGMPPEQKITFDGRPPGLSASVFDHIELSIA
jgi:hypothetical protein